MTISKMRKITLNVALAVTLAIVAGCVSKSYDKGAATSDALEASADAVSVSSDRVYDVLAAMNNLVFKSAGDLRDQYDAFTAANKNLDKANENLDSKVVQLRITAAAFSENWSNQLATIQNPDLRARSAARMDEVTAKLKDVDASYQGLKNSFKPFTSDTKDIQTYLGTDLTVAGLTNIKDVVSKTKVDAVPLRDSIKQLRASFSDLGTALSPVLPVPDKN
jgi:hypothetical protein